MPQKGVDCPAYSDCFEEVDYAGFAEVHGMPCIELSVIIIGRIKDNGGLHAAT
jgi:hypothetical protein